MNDEVFNAITRATRERRELSCADTRLPSINLLVGDLAAIFTASDPSFDIPGFYRACGLRGDDIAMINKGRPAVGATQIKAITEATRHQGYKNYETFTVAFSLNNDQEKQAAARLIARAGADDNEEFPEVGAASALREWVEAEQLTEDGTDAETVLSGIGSCLLNAAIGEVDWLEVAREFLGMRG